MPWHFCSVDSLSGAGLNRVRADGFGLFAGENGLYTSVFGRSISTNHHTGCSFHVTELIDETINATHSGNDADWSAIA